MKNKKILIIAAILLIIVAVINLVYESRSSPSKSPEIKTLGESRGVNGASANDKKVIPANQEVLAQINQIRNHLEHSPNDIDHWILLGNLLFDENRFEEAIEPYQKALALKPQNNDVRTDYGVSLFSTGRSEEAIQEFQTVLRSDARHLTAMFNIGVVYAHLGKNDQAREHWNRVIKTDPNSQYAGRAKNGLTQLK